MKKTNMNKAAAVMAAVMMAAVGYVGGKANTPTTIEPANIVVAHAAAAVEQEVKTTVEEPEEELVEEKKEEVGDIVKMLNPDGLLDGFVAYTTTGYHYEMYLPDLIEWINENTASTLRYDNAFGRFQVTNVDTGRAVRVTTMKEVKD